MSEYTPDERRMKLIYIADAEGPRDDDEAAIEAGDEFDRFISRVRDDARSGALIRGAEIGWDAAVNAMQYEDGTRPELVEVVNPYRHKEDA